MSRAPVPSEQVALEVFITTLDARGEPLPERQQNRRFSAAPITIGAAGTCDVVLPGLPRQACRIEPRTEPHGPTRYVLVRTDHTVPVLLNGQLLTADQAPLVNHSQWQVGSYRLRLVVRFRPVALDRQAGRAPMVALVLVALALLGELLYLVGVPRWVPVQQVLARESTRIATYAQVDRLRLALETRVKNAQASDPPGTTAMLVLVQNELSRMASYLRANDTRLGNAELARCRLDVETLATIIRDLDSGRLRLLPPPLDLPSGLDHVLKEGNPPHDP